MLQFHKSPFEKDHERIALERFFNSYIRRTKMSLNIFCSEDEETTDEEENGSENDDEEDEKDDEKKGTMKNDSNEPKTDGTKQTKEKDANNENNEGECQAFMDNTQKCQGNPICKACLEKGSILSVALLEALSRPIEEGSGSADQCGLRRVLDEMKSTD